MINFLNGIEDSGPGFALVGDETSGPGFIAGGDDEGWGYNNIPDGSGLLYPNDKT